MKSGDSPTTEELREVLLIAVKAARAGQEEKPPNDPPARLKHLLAFSKFSERALDRVREVVESDEEFRERVVRATTEEELSRVGWLWLARPNGWEQDCAELAKAARRESEQEAGVQSQQVLEQRLSRAESALARAERQRDKATRERDEALSQANQARAEAHRCEGESHSLAVELEGAREDRNSTQKSLERALRKKSRTDGKFKKAQREIERLNKELRDSREQHEEEVRSLTERLAAAEKEVATAREAGFEPPKEPEPESPPPPARRTPVPLPPGILKETVEAAEHLLRTPKVVVLIDGDNVTFTNWQEMPVREQRERLLQKLNELSARYQEAKIVVVFDGTQTDYDYIPPAPHPLEPIVRFSAPGVEADDVIIEWCSDYPQWQPLVVVSHDNRVRERSRELGANLVQPSNLLMLMGVEMESEDFVFGFPVR